MNHIILESARHGDPRAREIKILTHRPQEEILLLNFTKILVVWPLVGVPLLHEETTSKQIASSVLKEKLKDGSSSMSLASCQGQPVKVNVGNNPVRRSLSFPLVSHEGMSRMATDLGLSIRQTRQVAKHICQETGFRKAVEPRLDEKMQEMSHSLADFFECQVMSSLQRMSRESMFRRTDQSSIVPECNCWLSM